MGFINLTAPNVLNREVVNNSYKSRINCLEKAFLFLTLFSCMLF